MKLRSLVILGLVVLSPAVLRAQSADTPIWVLTPPIPPAAPVPALLPRPAVAVMAPAPVMVLPAPMPPRESMPEIPPAPPEPPQAVISPKPAVAPAAPAPPPPPAAPSKYAEAMMVNVRIDVTLTDSKGAPKVLTMTIANGESGMNRTTSVIAPGPGDNYSFNADASPTVVGAKVRLRLTADAVVGVEGSGVPPITRLALRQSQVVVVNDGQSLEIARAADPVSDRTFVLSVKATIQR